MQPVLINYEILDYLCAEIMELKKSASLKVIFLFLDK